MYTQTIPQTAGILSPAEEMCFLSADTLSAFIFMALTRSKKEEIVEMLTDEARKAQAIIFARFHGLSVAKALELRRLLRGVGARYAVAKKTLAAIALGNSGIELPKLEGEIAFVFGDDPIETAKGVYEFVRKNEELVIAGGVYENRLVDADTVVRLAKIPPREVLLSQFISIIQAPQRGLVGVLGGNLRKLVFVLGQIKK